MGSSTSSYDEREALRESLRSFFEKYCPEEEVRRLMATSSGLDPKLWQRIATDLGLLGFAVPEEYGGGGFAAADFQVVMEEVGRSLMPGPFLSSAVLATNVLLATEDVAVCSDVLPAMCAGTVIATVAATSTSGRWNADEVWDATAEQTAEGWLVTGRKEFVPDAQIADLFLVTARTSAGPALFLVRAGAAGVTRHELTTLDETRKQGVVEFGGVAAQQVGQLGQGVETLARALSVSSVALAGDQVGGARRALELAVDYAKVREQFGRVIGSFQAIKQKCADVLLAVEAATSATRAAADAVDDGSGEQEMLASLALGLATEAYLLAVHENIEVHGGIGFTWEASAHLYYKRAVADAAIFGSPSSQRTSLLTAMDR